MAKKAAPKSSKSKPMPKSAPPFPPARGKGGKGKGDKGKGGCKKPGCSCGK